MDIRIIVETTFEHGETQWRDIGHICRLLDRTGPESLRLRIAEAKSLINRLQETVLRDQIDEALEATRNCSACGNRRAIHDDRGRCLDTLYGRFRVKAPRFRQCPCERTDGVVNSAPGVVT